MHIAFATYPGLPDLTPSDRLAADELSRRGLSVTAEPWTGATDWGRFDAVVIRSTWDYYNHPTEFRSWLQTLGDQRVPLWNPAPLAIWNLHKGYLRDLERAGVNIVPTAWVSNPADAPSLEELIRSRGWTDVVAKPAVSASANRTWRTHGRVTDDEERQFRELAEAGEVMVQPFIESLAREGEWSFVFLGGEYSHAVLKRPGPGEFRVQPRLGGSAARQDAPTEWVTQARSILDAISGPWLYARVDGCIADGRFMLIELEMLEPDLFFNYEPGAPARFADALLRLLPSPDPRSYAPARSAPARPPAGR